MSDTNKESSTLFPEGMRIDACQQASPLDALETRMLLCHVTAYTRIQLITQSESTLSQTQAKELSALVQRRIEGEPMAYLLGHREFYGLTFKVTPDVLIPRPDTELLVDLALQFTPGAGSLLDLGTGSGAIAVAIAAQNSSLDVTAVDISAAALEVAKTNAASLLNNRPPIHFVQSSWYQQLPKQSFDTIVSNPPYIVKNDAHLSQGDLRFEPIDALTDHHDGLSAYREIISGAISRNVAGEPSYLRQNGWLLMEHGYDQSASVQDILTQHGFTQVQSWPDLAGILRVTGGQFTA